MLFQLLLPDLNHNSRACDEDILLMHCLLDKPQEDPNIRGDAFKTLIVARLSYEATEKDLESEFGRFGPIERVSFFKDQVPCVQH